MRKLASVQKILSIKAIPNADAIEVATVLGWEVVVKKGLHKVGELVAYFEIDSMLPKHPAFEFLGESSWKEKEQAYRLKTVKLRGQISQGLIMPLSYFADMVDFSSLNEGFELTEIFGIFKYEPPIPAELSGDAKSFSWPITKSDETRIQTIPHILDVLKGKPYYISSKLDGTSSSFMIDLNDEYQVCGHNYSFKEKEGNTFWKLSKQYGIKEILENEFNSTGIRYALQGETVGPGIQKNKLNLSTHDVYFFNLVDVNRHKVLSVNELVSFCEKYHLKTVPIIEAGIDFNYSFEAILKRADGFYKEDGFENANPKQKREGIVIRSIDSEISFKVISNAFLLEDKNDE